ncbi:MAG: zinc ribbon-containing protein [Spiribacter sp.]|jgi:rubrerythrin|nr:zinc ribbon-containing protein [Spiribacter sp.]MDR9489550.1 zinc ribbon-containing protein [Spiribacter sp.]
MTDPKERHEHEVKGYEQMLDRLRERLAHTGEALEHGFHEALNSVRERSIELGELTRDEADRVAMWLQRDLEDAAEYVESARGTYADWLYMDLQLVENWIWDRFCSVADQTRLQWQAFNQELQAAARYHTGELTGPGTLVCRECGERLHFERVGHIPPCPSCHGSRFERAARQ